MSLLVNLFEAMNEVFENAGEHGLDLAPAEKYVTVQNV